MFDGTSDPLSSSNPSSSKRPGRRPRRIGRGLVVSLVLLVSAVAGAIAWLLTPPPPYTPLTGQDPQKVALFALGDQGSGDLQQWRVAMGMERAAERNGGGNGGLLLGDNFYGPALKGTSDRTWQLRFERVYWGKWLSHVPFYAVLGNHDFPKSSSVELAYSREARGSRRWQMPDYFYTRDFGLVDGRPLLRVVFLNSSAPREGLLQQAEFIRQTFSAPGPAPIWKVVAAHIPPRNLGDHGNDDALLGDLLPALQQSGVDLYVAAHDHDQQLIVRPGEPAWVISGGGGQKLDALPPSASQEALYAASRPGFTGLQFTAQRVQLAYYDENGKPDHGFAWNRNCPWMAKGCLLPETDGQLAGN